MKVRNLNLKKLAVVQILIIGLLLTSLLYVWAQTGTTFTISQGIYPGAPSYTIWQEDSTYYAKNAYGAIDYYGTNASGVIQDSIDAMSNGQSLFIQNGGSAYTLLTSVEVSNKRIIITSDWATLNSPPGDYAIKVHNEAEYPLPTGIGVWDHADSIIERLVIDGQAQSGDGILIVDSYHITVQNLRLRNCRYGITLSNVTKWTEFVNLCHIQMQNCTRGIWFKGPVSFVNNKLYDIGIDMTLPNSYGLIIDDQDASLWGTIIQIMHIWIHNDTSTGLYLDGKIGEILIEELMIECFDSTPVNIYGIVLAATMDGAPLFIPYPSVYPGAYYTTTIQTNGMTYYFVDKRYQNSGTGEASNDDWIAHGLIGIAPTSIALTVEEIDANYFVQLKATNATHFQIYLYDATASTLETVDKTINWYAEWLP